MGEQRIWLDIELPRLLAHRPTKPDREQSAASISLHECGQPRRRILLGDQQRILLGPGKFELVALQLNRMRSGAAYLAAIRPLDGRQDRHAFGILARIVAQIAHDVRAALIGAEKEDMRDLCRRKAMRSDQLARHRAAGGGGNEHTGIGQLREAIIAHARIGREIVGQDRSSTLERGSLLVDSRHDRIE